MRTMMPKNTERIGIACLFVAIHVVVAMVLGQFAALGIASGKVLAIPRAEPDMCPRSGYCV